MAHPQVKAGTSGPQATYHNSPHLSTRHWECDLPPRQPPLWLPSPVSHVGLRPAAVGGLGRHQDAQLGGGADGHAVVIVQQPAHHDAGENGVVG